MWRGAHVWLFLAIAAAGCGSRLSVTRGDAGMDAGIVADASVVDAPADSSAIADAADDSGTRDDAGRDSGARDAGRDAGPRDAGQPDSGTCSPGGMYCDDATGSYYVCTDGMWTCSCGPCAGGTLACC